jgi:hypothetical protein
MKAINEVIKISILVEGPSAKGLPAQQVVSFEVLQGVQQYKAVPMLNASERKYIGLPEVICFAFMDQCIITERTLSEDMLEVIKNLIQELILQDVIS